MSEAKYLLQKITFLDAEIDSLIREHKNMKSTLLKATDYSNEPVSTTKRNSSEEKLVKLADKSSEIDVKIDELVDFKITTGDYISQLEDERHRVILRERYINGLSFREIAKIVGYTERHLHRIHGEALVEFQKILNDVI